MGSSVDRLSCRECRPEAEPVSNSRALSCIARNSLDPRRYRVLFGEAHTIAEALAGPHPTAPFFLSMHLVLRALRTNAKLAGIALPKRLTVAEGEPGYKEWRAEIARYQEAAGVRLAKSKPAAKPMVKA